MHTFALLAMFALLLLPGSTALAHDSRGLTRVESEALLAENENYAVTVGIDRYENIGNLSHAVDDAKRLTSLFEDQGYEVFTLTNYEANPRRILDAITRAARLATNDGRAQQGNVVFAFSGHGFRDGSCPRGRALVDESRLTDTTVTTAHRYPYRENDSSRSTCMMIDTNEVRAIARPLLLLTAAAVLLGGCATQPDMAMRQSPGFFTGLFHGFFVLFAFVGSWFADVRMYAFPNTGAWYDLGFLIGMLCFFGGGASASSD